MTERSRVLAVDLGATSVRVAAVDLDVDQPSVDVIQRWHHSPELDSEGALRWDWDGIVRQVETGLALGLESGPVASIGVDGWGVDYGLIDETGDLVDQPYAYRDSRTDNWGETVHAIGKERLYEITGVQLMGLNTIFQVAADTEDRHARAERLLLLPDLLVNQLSGWVGVERSNLSTTGLMDVRTGDWSDALIAEIGAARHLFPEPAQAGQFVGEWRGIPVCLVGSHDTASAFLGAPRAGPENVFVSTGSWVIVGVERRGPDTSPVALAGNFSNEAGALGGIRFLKNVVGFWVLERCRDEWNNPPIEELISEAEDVEEPVPIFDASDQQLLTTPDMLSTIHDMAGLSYGAPRGVIVRAVIESIADGVVRVMHEIEASTDRKLSTMALVGGGSRIGLLAELLRARSGLDVSVGSPEATALGNAIVQGIAIGRFDDIRRARDWLSPRGVAA